MGNGTITMTGAEYDALASKIATLEAENAKLRAELERLAVDGWKLVPVEATREMCLAAAQERREYPIPSDRESPVVLWRAMLAAAPSAPATVQGDGNIVLNTEAQQIIAQCIGAHAYIVGALENGRPDLAITEAKKWVDAFGAAARQEGGKV